MKIIVAIFENRNAERDVRAFLRDDGAVAWRDEIVRENWPDELGAMPDNSDEAATMFFESDFSRDMQFDIDEVHVDPDGGAMADVREILGFAGDVVASMLDKAGEIAAALILIIGGAWAIGAASMIDNLPMA